MPSKRIRDNKERQAIIMLANRPRGISINRNANNLVTVGGNAANQANLKRSLQAELDGPLKGAGSSKTPSPPKLRSQFSNNNVKQSENDVPALIDLKAVIIDELDLQKQPFKQTTTEVTIKRQSTTEPLIKQQEQQQPKSLRPLAILQPTSNLAVISRIPRLKEVEEEIEDIDKSSESSRDAIFQVSDIAKDIYAYMYDLEDIQAVPEDFLKNQKIYTPRVRQRLVNWCVDLAKKFEVLAETMYMTISLLDRYFDKVVVEQKSQVQLVALGALLIASKYEEIYPPDVNDLLSYSDNVYSRRDLMKIEIDILEKLNFDLGKPIPAAFLRRFSKAAHCDHKMHSIGKFLMEISLTEYECAHWKPSLLAATALYVTVHLVHSQNNHQESTSMTGLRSTRISSAASLQSSRLSCFGLTARRTLMSPPAVQERWNKTLVHYTRYSRQELRGPAAILCKILKRVLKTPQTLSAAKSHMHNLSKWPELKSTRVDELIRLGDNLKLLASHLSK